MARLQSGTRVRGGPYGSGRQEVLNSPTDPTGQPAGGGYLVATFNGQVFVPVGGVWTAASGAAGTTEVLLATSDPAGVAVGTLKIAVFNDTIYVPNGGVWEALDLATQRPWVALDDTSTTLEDNGRYTLGAGLTSVISITPTLTDGESFRIADPRGIAVEDTLGIDINHGGTLHYRDENGNPQTTTLPYRFDATGGEIEIIQQGAGVFEALYNNQGGGSSSGTSTTPTTDVEFVRDQFTATAGQSVFALSATPTDVDSLEAVIAGAPSLVLGTHYTYTAPSTLTLLPQVSAVVIAGDVVEATYI